MGISHGTTILFRLLVLLAALMTLRQMGMLPGMEYVGDKTKSVEGSNRASRRAEALILLMVAVAVFVFTATNTSTGGRLLTLDQYRFGFAVTNVVAAAVIALVVFVGVFVVLKGRTAIGTIVVIVALWGYGMLFNGPNELLESLAPEGSTIPPSTLIFRMGQTDADCAQLWVNGVRLGTLPYETTFEEFYEKVPYWAEKPNEMKDENWDMWLAVPHYSWPGSGSVSYEMPWARIKLPQEPVHWDERHSHAGKADEERTYYARVKLGDEWGYCSGGSGASSRGSGRYSRRSANVHFDFIFPERQKRIEKLLDVARAHDYEPGGDWFVAAETYNSDGWIAAANAMKTEPDMQRLLDAWAVWRYDLDEVSDADMAWAKFEQICDEADRRRYYLTSGVAGRAVELLVSRLDDERLVERAVKLIRGAKQFRWWTWETNGRIQFGYTELSQGLHTGGEMHRERLTGDPRLGGLPISGYVVAHAVWQLHEMLQADAPSEWNIVQEKVVPEVVRWYPDRRRLLRIACYFGGPQLERYLLRQSWRIDPEELSWREQMHLPDGVVNVWLYLLVHLRSEAGREFRREHQPAVLDAVDVICRSRVDDYRDVGNELRFLYSDLEAGHSCLAYQYWPRFCKYARTNSRVGEPLRPLRFQWAYLLEMEPISTVEMYLEAWREIEVERSDCSSALRLLGELPDKKRRTIAEGLIDHIRKNGPAKLDGMTSGQMVGEILPYLEAGGMDQWQARRILDGIVKGGERYTREDVRVWLAESEPWHPLVKVLADSSDPELRVLMMGAVVSHPTPGNREILGRLLEDPDNVVSAGAQEARANVEELKSTPLVELAHVERR